MVALRYIFGLVLGVGACVVTWSQVVFAHPIFREVGLSGLVPAIAGGVAGGFVCGAFAPRFKVVFSGAVGLALAIAGVVFIFGYFQVPRGSPILLYWPAYCFPSFVGGGMLSRGVWSRAA
jgi:hypothetical protein